MDRTAAYREAIERRRQFQLAPFRTLNDAGLDGDYVSPIQIASGNLNGPMLIAKDWFDFPSAVANRELLSQLGYMPNIKFNNVLDLALNYSAYERQSVYLTQVFHLLPPTRSYSFKVADLRNSFEAVTKYELFGRRPVALGSDASAILTSFGIPHEAAPHPSSRKGTNAERARAISEAVSRVSG
ncbi:hypothetical protein [Pararhodobacter sp. CCB-MM2]|uniref:hypothetical protein n=1 Tax=Pararhodobacter sp. CCB-MM2 TaxID=1786003 RepID=UPI0009F5245A|nr:hypothetical protein [Pararhodobacter sp. CCB-MM2]